MRCIFPWEFMWTFFRDTSFGRKITNPGQYRNILMVRLYANPRGGPKYRCTTHIWIYWRYLPGVVPKCSLNTLIK